VAAQWHVGGEGWKGGRETSSTCPRSLICVRFFHPPLCFIHSLPAFEGHSLHPLPVFSPPSSYPPLFRFSAFSSLHTFPPSPVSRPGAEEHCAFLSHQQCPRLDLLRDHGQNVRNRWRRVWAAIIGRVPGKNLRIT